MNAWLSSWIHIIVSLGGWASVDLCVLWVRFVVELRFVSCCLGLVYICQCRLDIQCRRDFVKEVIPIMHIFVCLDIVGKQIPFLDIVFPRTLYIGGWSIWYEQSYTKTNIITEQFWTEGFTFAAFQFEGEEHLPNHDDHQFLSGMLLSRLRSNIRYTDPILCAKVWTQSVSMQSQRGAIRW